GVVDLRVRVVTRGDGRSAGDGSGAEGGGANGPPLEDGPVGVVLEPSAVGGIAGGAEAGAEPVAGVAAGQAGVVAGAAGAGSGAEGGGVGVGCVGIDDRDAGLASQEGVDETADLPGELCADLGEPVGGEG